MIFSVGYPALSTRISCAVIKDIDGVTVGFDVEKCVGRELQEIQAGEVAGGIVEEHVFAAGLLALMLRCFRSVPAIDGGVVLHAGSPQCQCFGEFAH